MSSGGQIAGGIVGAIVGYVGTGFNPAGAYYGAMIGAGIGGYLDPPKGPTVEGPRLNDLKVQTSTYGVIVPRVYRMIGISGNVLWLENNQLKETVKKKKQGGKGGGSSSTLKTYSYSATFALGLCEGPIVGVRRIWCGDKLIYNAGSKDLETIIASNRVAAGFRVYYGTDDQLPDARYEANVGVGNAPAFRGLAYIVFYDFQLADYGNSLQGAQFKVEVVGAGSEVESIYINGDTENIPDGYNAWCVYSPFGGDSIIKTVVANRPWYLTPDFNSYLTYYSGQTKYGAYLTTRRGGAQSCKYIGSKGPLYNTSVYMNSMQYDGIEYPIADTYIIDWAPTKYGILIIDDSYIINLVSTSGIEKTYTCDGYSRFFVDGESVYVFETGKSTVLELKDLNVVSISENDFIIDDNSFVSGGDGKIYISRGVGSYAEFSSIGLLNTDLSSFEHVYSLPSFSSTVSDLAAAIFAVSNGVLLRVACNQTGTLQWDTHRLYGIDIESLPVATVIEAEVSCSNLLSQDDIDTSLLVSSLSGYKVSGGSIRAAIEPLQGAFPFDVRQHGYLIQCVPRGQSPVASVAQDDLGASEDGGSPLLEVSREMDSQLPVRTTVKYIDASREYDTAEQYSERVNTKAINRVDREFPLVMSADKAAQVAEMLEFSPWIERSEYKFTLPPTMLGVEPADVISVNTEEASYEFRLVETNESPDGSIECKARPNKASLWSSSASGGESPGPDGTIGLDGDTLFLALDIPVVDESLQNETGFVGVATGYLSSWPGAVIFRSSDGGQTWDDLQGFPGKCTIGRVRSKLLMSSSTHIDQSSIVVDMISGEISSVTRDQMLSGQNYVAYGANGRWEIIRFQNAALQADGSYLVSGFVRGEFGTEWATGLHAESDWFVFLSDPDNQFIGMTTASIGQQLIYRGVTNGADILSADDQQFTYSGVNLECLSPVYARGIRDGSWNFSATFTRRSRLSGAWWTTGIPSPVGESAEAYEIDVMSGASVKRTITSASEAFSYSAANQVSDFGSVQSSITFRIYQISAVVGRGYPLEVTL
ncbi:phage tail protein [Metapseudomonas otitidis]|uniref:phage tail protein n=1 Tax=Metapseudomonas otitidis TaxID=319939 RepID=UPI00244B2DCB|nr:phage tail protein [Pseudomonas otitidis]MDH0335204.1 phage tail protein [Pseudomonas otitidis]